MTRRQEAIAAVQATWAQAAGKFCVNQAEYDDSERECREVLLALGVTEEELV